MWSLFSNHCLPKGKVILTAHPETLKEIQDVMIKQGLIEDPEKVTEEEKTRRMHEALKNEPEILYINRKSE